MKCSKLIVLLVLVLSTILGNVSAYAESNATVYADTPINSVDNSIIIPVSIDNNPGLMGFKFHFEISKGIKANSVSKGNVTENGMLTDNIGINEGSFDVLWNNSEEVKDNGVLFYIGISSDDFSKESISILYSENDTFNEQFENVNLDCKRIKLENKKSNEIVISKDAFTNEAIVNDIAQTVIRKENDIPLSKEYGKEKVLSELSKDSQETISSLPDEIQDDVIETIYKESTEKTEENTVDESNKETVDKIIEQNNSKTVIVIILVLSIVAFIIVLIIMRKKK